MTTDVAELDRLADRLAEVDERGAAVAGARIVEARRVAGHVRQLDERHVLAQRHGIRRRRHAADRAGEQAAAETAAAATAAGRADRRRTLGRTAAATATAAGRLVDEGQRHVDFGVLREVARVGQVERAARAIDAVVARPQARRRVRRHRAGRSRWHRPARGRPIRPRPRSPRGSTWRTSPRPTSARAGSCCSIGTTGCACTSITRGPTRWNWTRRPPPRPEPRSRPMSFEPRPADSPVENRKSVSNREISRNIDPVRSSQ